MSSRRDKKRQGVRSRQWLGRAAALFGVGAFVVLVAAYVGVRKYLHSEGFRRLLSEEASRTLGISGEFSSFRWDGLQVDTPSFEAIGEGKVRSLRAENVHTEIGLGQVTKGTWQLRGSNVGSIEATVDARSGANGIVPPVASTPGANSEAKKNGWLPSEVDLDGLTIQSLSLRALMNSGIAAISDMQVQVEQAETRHAYRATVEGGRVALPWKLAPAVMLDRVKLRYQDDQIFITDATATVAGRVQASGEWAQSSGDYELQGNMSDVPCADLLSADWAKRLTGKVDSTFIITSHGSGPTFHGELAVRDGTLTALPVLDSLAAYADTRRFRVLQLSSAQTDWKWENGVTTLRRLVLANEGLIRLEGQLTIGKNGELDGSFRLGLAPGLLSNIPGAETNVFLPGEKSLLWTPLSVSGTLDAPKEDLTDRLIMAAGLRMFDVLPQSGEKALKFTRSVLGDTQDKIIGKGVKTLGKGIKALDKAGDVVDGVNSVIDGFFGRQPAKPAPQPAVESPPH
jgi:hypothetical protein